MSATFDLAVRVVGRGELLVEGGKVPSEWHRLEVVLAAGLGSCMNFTVPADFVAHVGATLRLQLSMPEMHSVLTGTAQ